MIKCNYVECRIFNGCCAVCPECPTCSDACNLNPTECGLSENVNELTVFESKALQVMQAIVDIDRQKKMLDAQDAEMRGQLQAVMDEYGIKNFENDILKITYIAPTTRETVDSKKLKADLPEVAAKYTKITQVKGSVRIQVK